MNDEDGAQLLASPMRAALAQGGVPGYEAEILLAVPHDEALFTEGLCTGTDGLLETAGGYGESRLIRYSPAGAQVVMSASAPSTVYTEGTCILGEYVYQLTWRDRLALLWRLPALTLEKQVPYDREGWGICHDGKAFYTTDGSSEVTIRDLESLAPVGSFRATIANGGDIDGLNDITFDGEALWISIVRSHWLVRVDHHSGSVIGAINLRRLFIEAAGKSEWGVGAIAVAESSSGSTIWTTGKHFPRLLQLRLRG